MGAVGWDAITHRADGTRTVAYRTEPLLVETEDLYVALADAHATVASTFVTGGIESADLHRRYSDDLTRAAQLVTRLSGQVGGSGPMARRYACGRAVESADATWAIRVLDCALPVYTGLIESARANNREGLPLGAGYLRSASTVMRSSLLVAARRLYEDQAEQLTSAYRTGTSSNEFWVFVILMILALALFGVAQLFLFRTTHRILSVPIVAAVVLIVIAGAWTGSALASQRAALLRAKGAGSDEVELLSAAGTYTLWAEGDELLALVSRGSGGTYLDDFDRVTNALVGPDRNRGVLMHARTIAAEAGSSAPTRILMGAVTRWLAVHAEVQRRWSGGCFADAVRLAVRESGPSECSQIPVRGAATTEAAAASMVVHDAERAIGQWQRRFDASSAAAVSDVTFPRVAVPLMALLAGLAAAIGFMTRIAEYR
jgi:hypothetical protein